MFESRPSFLFYSFVDILCCVPPTTRCLRCNCGVGEPAQGEICRIFDFLCSLFFSDPLLSLLLNPVAVCRWWLCYRKYKSYKKLLKLSCHRAAAGRTEPTSTEYEVLMDGLSSRLVMRPWGNCGPKRAAAEEPSFLRRQAGSGRLFGLNER